jgi:ubiquinone/menaquinone biosynthesis C-methylase UbiE
MTESSTARYDGLATWYDDYNAASARDNREPVIELLGPGTGWCLDVGCGTGQYFEAIRSTGRTPVGLDRSIDQLRIAGERDRAVVQGDAAALPFADASFPTVVSLWASTDVDDWDQVMREAARVLQPGGRFVFYGAHPCFNGPHVQNRDDGARIIHPVYRDAGWHEAAPWWSSGGVRQRLGMRHLPLSELLNGVLNAGLSLTHVCEPREHSVPYILAFSAHRSIP